MVRQELDNKGCVRDCGSEHEVFFVLHAKDTRMLVKMKRVGIVIR